MKGVTVVLQLSLKIQRNNKQKPNKVEYIAGRSFLFFFLNKSLDLTFFLAIADLSILFLVQSLLLSMVSCNAKLVHPVQASRITYGT